MRRNRRNNGKRERIVMIASSVFVLAALTMTGVYMQSKNTESEDDGYTIDFTALENNADSKTQEIAQNRQSAREEAQTDMGDTASPGKEILNLEDDLDYMPMEAGSNLVEIPGLTDGTLEETEDPAAAEEPDATEQPDATEEPDAAAAPKASSAENAVVTKELHFAEADGLVRPLEGEVLMPFSMDSSIYFSTLDQYKYNPALMLQAEEGTTVAACAEGRVTEIYDDAEIGHAVKMELGDGYEIIYGQLEEISVSLGSYVNPGETVGKVAAPTKYFSVEGSNLYLKLTADGVPVDPEALF